MERKGGYIPNKGDIVWIDFNPAAGNEIKKRRPGLVVSRYGFNHSTSFAVVCPITNTIKDFPTRYLLPEKAKIQGQVIVSQLKSLDFKARQLEFADRLPTQDMSRIDQIIEFIF